MRRRIVQLAALSATEAQRAGLFALDNLGDAWVMWGPHIGNAWFPLPKLPATAGVAPRVDVTTPERAE